MNESKANQDKICDNQKAQPCQNKNELYNKYTGHIKPQKTINIITIIFLNIFSTNRLQR